MIKLCIHLHSLQIGGAEINAIRLANEIANLSNFTVYVVSNKDGELKSKINNNVNTVILDCRTRYSIQPLIKTLKRLYITHVLSMSKATNLTSIIACYFSNTKNLFLREANVLSSPKIIEIGYLYTYLFLGRLVGAKYILNSQETKISVEKYFGLHRIKNEIIGNPILPTMSMCKHNEFPRIDIKNTLKLVSVGRLVPQKNYLYILIQLRELEQKYNVKFQLDIIGAGICKDGIKKFIKDHQLSDNVAIVEPTVDPINYEKYHASILASRFEGFGNVAIESLMAGIPVFYSQAIGSMSDIDRYYHESFCIRPKAELSTLLFNFTQDNHEKRSQLVKTGRAYANSFLLSNIVGKYVDFFKEHSRD